MELAVQDAVLDALSSDPAVSGLVVGVYDSVPQVPDSGAALDFPYIAVGEDTAQEWDTDTEVGGDFTITIHSWSRHRGRAEIKQIQGAVYAALHRATLAVAGYAFVSCDFQQSDSIVDTDEITRHGVQTFRVLIDQL